MKERALIGYVEECVPGRDMSEKCWIRFGIGDWSVQDRGRPWVSRVGMPRSRSRFSTALCSGCSCFSGVRVTSLAAVDESRDPHLARAVRAMV